MSALEVIPILGRALRFRDGEIILNYIATTDSRINAKSVGTDNPWIRMIISSAQHRFSSNGFSSSKRIIIIQFINSEIRQKNISIYQNKSPLRLELHPAWETSNRFEMLIV